MAYKSIYDRRLDVFRSEDIRFMTTPLLVIGAKVQE
jgi:hypothetical protein